MKSTKTLAAGAAAIALGASLAALVVTNLGAVGAGTATAITEVAETGTRLLRYNGTAQRAGNGTVRTYVLVDPNDASVPVEIGVALSEQSMFGLQAPVPVSAEHAHDKHHAEMLNMHNWILELPKANPTPYTFVQFGWNPIGHEPPGVWDVPHFDFHFWEAPLEVRNSIVPGSPGYAEKAARYPAAEYRAPFYLDGATAAKVEPVDATVPQMGVHWIDVRTPEIQALAGNPAGYKPFTRTYIYGSWDGQFVFGEPMITRAYIMSKKTETDPALRDELIPISLPAKVAKPGYYPGAYRIRWDAKSKEYRISLNQFRRMD